MNESPAIEKLNIDIDHLLRLRGIESERVEFKASWDKETTGPQILKTLCAYANDLHNVNGGWVVLGVQEEGGRAVLPPKGLDAEEASRAASWIAQNAQNIDPALQPRISNVLYDGRQLIVVWMPASENRPHRVKTPKSDEQMEYYVRVGAANIVARGATLDALMQMSTRVPWDSRRALTSAVTDIRMSLVREYLREQGSSLAEDPDEMGLLRGMNLIARTNGHEVPINAALLFFTDDPARYFPCAWIHVVERDTVPGSDEFTRREFRGPLHHQVRNTVSWIVSRSGVEQSKDRLETASWQVFPELALREAISNAVYHRSYEGTNEPVNIVIEADRIEIWSYPGPLPSLKREHLSKDGAIPQLPARNRLIGDLLRRVKLAEQFRSGVKTIYRAMTSNGSPEPIFDWDEERTWFKVTLRAHMGHVVRATLRQVATLRAQGMLEQAVTLLRARHIEAPGSVPLTSELVQLLCQERRPSEALEVFERFHRQRPPSVVAVAAPLARALIDLRYTAEAMRVLDSLPGPHRPADALMLAEVERKLGRFVQASEHFEQAGEIVYDSVESINAFARTRFGLADALRAARDRAGRDMRRHELLEAETLFRQVIAHPEGGHLRGWAWYDLSKVLAAKRASAEDVRHAREQAQHYASQDPRLERALRER